MTNLLKTFLPGQDSCILWQKENHPLNLRIFPTLFLLGFTMLQQTKFWEAYGPAINKYPVMEPVPFMQGTHQEVQG